MRRRTPEPSSAIGSYGHGGGRSLLEGNCRPGSVLSAPTRLPPAAQARPEFDRAVHSCLEELQALEQEGSPSLDRTADTFARILAAAALPGGVLRPDPAPWSSSSTMWGGGFTWWTPGTIWRRTDAPGPTTPCLPVFRAGGGQRDYLRTTLLHSLNLARSACALLELGHWQGAVENILYLGLPMVEEMVFTGRWKAVNHQNRRRIS